MTTTRELTGARPVTEPVVRRNEVLFTTAAVVLGIALAWLVAFLIATYYTIW